MPMQAGHATHSGRRHPSLQLIMKTKVRETREDCPTCGLLAVPAVLAGAPQTAEDRPKRPDQQPPAAAAIVGLAAIPCRVQQSPAARCRMVLGSDAIPFGPRCAAVWGRPAGDAPATLYEQESHEGCTHGRPWLSSPVIVPSSHHVRSSQA